MRKTVLGFIIGALGVIVVVVAVCFVGAATEHDTTTERVTKVEEPITAQVSDTESTSTTINEEAIKININTADAALLASLPGIGKVKADAIVKYRNEHGNFVNLDDLTKVKGVGKKTANNIASIITFE